MPRNNIATNALSLLPGTPPKKNDLSRREIIEALRGATRRSPVGQEYQKLGRLTELIITTALTRKAVPLEELSDEQLQILSQWAGIHRGKGCSCAGNVTPEIHVNVTAMELLHTGGAILNHFWKEVLVCLVDDPGGLSVLGRSLEKYPWTDPEATEEASQSTSSQENS